MWTNQSVELNLCLTRKLQAFNFCCCWCLKRLFDLEKKTTNFLFSQYLIIHSEPHSIANQIIEWIDIFNILNVICSFMANENVHFCYFASYLCITEIKLTKINFISIQISNDAHCYCNSLKISGRSCCLFTKLDANNECRLQQWASHAQNAQTLQHWHEQCGTL